VSVDETSPTFQGPSPFPSSGGASNVAHAEPTDKADSPRRFHELQQPRKLTRNVAVVWRLSRHTMKFAFPRDALQQAVTRHLEVGAVTDQFRVTVTARGVSCQSPMATCNLLLLTCCATPEPPGSSPRNWRIIVPVTSHT
jgi:hypothetical protein